jgi:hypothetical protein
MSVDPFFQRGPFIADSSGRSTVAIVNEMLEEVM